MAAVATEKNATRGSENVMVKIAQQGELFRRDGGEQWCEPYRVLESRVPWKHVAHSFFILWMNHLLRTQIASDSATFSLLSLQNSVVNVRRVVAAKRFAKLLPQVTTSPAILPAREFAPSSVFFLEEGANPRARRGAE